MSNIPQADPATAFFPIQEELAIAHFAEIAERLSNSPTIDGILELSVFSHPPQIRVIYDSSRIDQHDLLPWLQQEGLQPS